MLLHRLPLDQTDLCRVTPDLPAYEIIDFPRLNLRVWIAALCGADLLAASVLGVALLGARVPAAPQDAARLLPAVAGAAALWLVTARAQRLYDRAKITAGRSNVINAAANWAASCVILLLLALALDPAHGVVSARGAGFALSSLAAVVGVRVVWQACMHAAVMRGQCLERTMVLGQTAAAARAAASGLERRQHGRIRVAATAPFPGLPDSPGFGWIEAAVRDRRIDRILIADSARTRDLYAVIMPRLTRLDVDVTVMPQADLPPAAPVRPGVTGAAPDRNIPHGPLDCSQAAAKRAFDLAVAVPALILTGPLMLIIGLLIKLDSPGPVLFTQNRIGLRGACFRIWKFRTMRHEMSDHSGARQTSRDDDRVTRVGRFLRRTSLDELPQLMNVFRGEMSIVGPRPHTLGMTVAGRPLHELVDGYAQRYAIKPGITGWAQVNGCRGEIDSSRKLRRRVALDCHYIDNWSLAADAWIIVRTASLFAFDRHAY